MPTFRALILGTLIGAAIAISTIAPASAAEPAGAVRNESINAAAVEVAGATWSAPAYPVDCEEVDRQISCTPVDATSVTAQRCFTGVVLNGGPSIICTTYEGHINAIQAAGGRELLVKYGCSLGDAVCVTFESAGRGLAMSATAMMFVVAANMQFDTSTLLWTAAVGEWSFWQWAILIVTFGAMVWAVAAAVVSGDRDELVGALVRSFIAIPAVPISLWLTGHLLNSVDQMTWYILHRDGVGGLFATLQSVMWAGGQANYFFAFIIHGMLMIGMLLLMLVFAFRNIVLAALIAVGPVAWMMFPLRGIGPQWVVRYVSAIVVLLLTGPLTVGFVMLIVNGLAGVKTIWDPQSWPLLIGLVLVAFAPFALFGLFSFVGAVAADGVGSHLGTRGGQVASRAARSAVSIPSRIGALPSGVRPGGSSPTATRPSSSTATRVSGARRAANSPAQARTPMPSRSAGSSPASVASPPQPPSTPAGAPTDRKPS
ncbi:hypothetical protein [Microbacterium lacus]|uniref:TrbL/VirB6 plasmid conjugal transfer protein n=1 Tax=Microbacterium lacus TaxID=415217 RepID=A0ABN2FWU5_9MICO